MDRTQRINKSCTVCSPTANAIQYVSLVCLGGGGVCKIMPLIIFWSKFQEKMTNALAPSSSMSYRNRDHRCDNMLAQEFMSFLLLYIDLISLSQSFLCYLRLPSLHLVPYNHLPRNLHLNHHLSIAGNNSSHTFIVKGILYSFCWTERKQKYVFLFKKICMAKRQKNGVRPHLPNPICSHYKLPLQQTPSRAFLPRYTQDFSSRNVCKTPHG
jgi:hypothetical protein